VKIDALLYICNDFSKKSMQMSNNVVEMNAKTAQATVLLNQSHILKNNKVYISSHLIWERCILSSCFVDKRSSFLEGDYYFNMVLTPVMG